jgi:light-regulated signal transduction histidine kinase (bacteriophytochrome)
VSEKRRQPTILIVDDSATFREELREVFERAGYEVVTAASGEEGLNVAAEQRPSAIVVDGVLSSSDGATRAALVDELERKNRELESFSYSVSHDLRSPLRSIDGFSQALLEDYSDKLDARGQDYLHRVRAATQRMGELIDDLLQLARVGRAELKRERVDLSTLANSVMAELRRQDPDRLADIRIQACVTVDADRRLMKIVLENLLGNAWKFTSKVPHPKIELAAATIEGHETFFVRDNGAGFDMSYADKLFRPFQRLHSESEFPGTGIGLATIQRVLDRHGGRAWVEAAPNQGATVFFTLSSRVGSRR